MHLYLCVPVALFKTPKDNLNANRALLEATAPRWACKRRLRASLESTAINQAQNRAHSVQWDRIAQVQVLAFPHRARRGRTTLILGRIFRRHVYHALQTSIARRVLPIRQLQMLRRQTGKKAVRGFPEERLRELF